MDGLTLFVCTLLFMKGIERYCSDSALGQKVLWEFAPVQGGTKGTMGYEVL
jgi:hypothetical protein